MIAKVRRSGMAPLATGARKAAASLIFVSVRGSPAAPPTAPGRAAHRDSISTWIGRNAFRGWQFGRSMAQRLLSLSLILPLAGCGALAAEPKDPEGATERIAATHVLRAGAAEHPPWVRIEGGTPQ